MEYLWGCRRKYGYVEGSMRMLEEVWICRRLLGYVKQVW